MRIGHELKADKGVVPLEKDLLLSGSLKRSSVLVLDVAVGGDEKPAGARGRVLHDLAGLRLHEPDDAIDQRARREILPRAGFLLGGVLLQQALRRDCRALPRAPRTNRACRWRR